MTSCKIVSVLLIGPVNIRFLFAGHPRTSKLCGIVKNTF
jgi:hypothetical protein